MARRSLAEFVRQAWPVVEPGTPLVWNWHISILCDALERQIRGEPEYRKLLICVPPGTMKSLLVSVFAPAWQWLEQPERRKLFLANDIQLATRDSRRTRQIITSDWYLGVLAYVSAVRKVPQWELADDQNEKVNFANTRHGSRQCLSIGAAVTGKRADDIVIDDPIDAKEIVNGSVEQVNTRLAETANVVDKVLPSRVNDLANARWTIIMQRLHEDDTAGHAIREGGWHVVNLQMEFEPGNVLNHPSDPRTQAGELLFEAKFPLAEIAKLKVKLGPRAYSAQYQQRPLPGDGGPLKRWYWCYWYPEGAAAPPPVRVTLPDGTLHECKQAPLPAGLHTHRQSWDMAFKDTKDSAYVVGQVWAELGADSYLLDQTRAKLDINGTLEAVRALTKAWPQALEKLVEDKANGPAVVGMLRREIPGFVEIEPDGGKEARANAVAPACRSGNAWLPHPALFPWVKDFLDETESFPGGSYADQVDAATQYLNRRYATVPIVFL
jgi:predicted phage terminase large subunit-like protein